MSVDSAARTEGDSLPTLERKHTETEARRHLRCPVRLSARLHSLNGRRSKAITAADVLNISESGLLLELRPGARPSPQMLVEFWLPAGTLGNADDAFVRAPARMVRDLASRNGHAPRIAVEFEQRITPAQRRSSLQWTPLAGLFLAAAALFLIAILKIQAIDYFWYRVAFGVYGLVVTSYILSRFLIASFYRPPRAVGYRPSVSVVVAAKNEELAIGDTLEAIFASDYPRDLLHVIAIDDGSTDDTHARMLGVRRRHPELEIIRFATNRGKRHGMAAGARRATGEVLVYVDSDSFLERDAIERLVQGFADPSVAAVCAHGQVANAWTNTLTRMQALQYYIAFRVLKGAESVFSSVTCCSGCCAAYRRSVVLEVLDDWLHQRFLGREATFGDDRSLTNRMLRKYRVIYDETARVSTIVPDTLRQFFRQQLRWKKSWLRENAIAATFMWRKAPIMAASFYVGFIFPLFAPIVVGRAVLYLPVLYGRTNYFYFLGIFLISLIYAAYYLTRQRNRLWIYGPLVCFFFALVVSWQLPWAIATSWDNKWGTR